MNYSKIITYDICNGKGWRVSLFVSGCKRNCKGCFNPQSHDPCYGKPFTNEVKEHIYHELEKDNISGLSVLGGEPMSVLSDNRSQVIQLCKDIKEKFPNKDIWMWTGYLAAELIEDKTTKDIFKYIDVIIDGAFEEELKDPNLEWKGSSNQTVWKIQKITDTKYELKAIDSIKSYTIEY